MKIDLEKKPFALFAGSHYYPSGGWQDFRGTHATVMEASKAGIARVQEHVEGWYQVVDMRTLKIVYEGSIG